MKPNRYNMIYSETPEKVYTSSIRDPNDASILLDLPRWMKDEMKKRYVVNRYIRSLIVADFAKRGIRKPYTAEEIEKYQKELVGI
jgi:hypothetical protein